MNPEDWQEFQSLEKELLDSPGWRFEQRLITNLGTTFHIFQANQFELCKRITWFEEGKDSFQLLDVNKKEQLHSFLREVLRFFHNYLASVATLRDHTRNILKEFEEDGFIISDYGDKVAQLFATPESQFIQQSRNYMLHNTCIFTGSRLHWDQSGEFSLSITFSLKELKEWDNWNAKSRQFLEAQTEDPRLLPLIESYTKGVDEFYFWFVRRLEEMHKDELMRSNELKARMKALLEKDSPNP
jgi:hypothetical protein